MASPASPGSASGRIPSHGAGRRRGAALSVAVLVAAGCGSGGDGPPRHLQAVLAGTEDPLAGWWSLDLDGEMAHVVGPTGADVPIGEVLRFGTDLSLGPIPGCGDGRRGLYAVIQEGDSLTFDVQGSDGCPEREALLTGAVWQPYAPPRRTEAVPPVRPARPEAVVPLEGHPSFLAYAAGSVWVARARSRTVARIDAATNRVVALVDMGRVDDLRGLGAGGGAVWVSDGGRDRMSRIDPATNSVTATVRVEVNRAGDLLATADGLWVSDGLGGSVSRLDPATAAVTGTVRVGPEGPGGPQALASFGGQVLVLVPNQHRVARIDPATGDVSTFSRGRATGRMAVTGDAVWLVEGLDATWVTRVDATGAPDLRVSVGEGRHPRALAASGPTLWVLTVGDGSPTSRMMELLAVDVRSGEVLRRVDVARNSGRHSLVVDAGGDVWVATADAVVRIDGPPDG